MVSEQAGESVGELARVLLLADLLWFLAAVVTAIALVLLVRWLLSDWFEWGDDADF